MKIITTFVPYLVVNLNHDDMNLPDFMSYSNKFTASEFIEKISRIAKRAGAKLVYAAFILYYTLQSDKGDDLAVLVYVLNKVWGNVSDEIKEKAKSKLSKWFDEDEIAEINTLFDKDKE